MCNILLHAAAKGNIHKQIKGLLSWDISFFRHKGLVSGKAKLLALDGEDPMVHSSISSFKNVRSLPEALV